MRELKFRAWSIKFEEYIEDVIHDGSSWLEAHGYDYVTVSEIFDGDEFIVEQYTGLKDKNGKEIYEGDIVDYNDDGECIGVVEYDAPEFYLNADATNWAKMFLKGTPHQKVVGNIHENPELLGDEK